MLDYQSGILSLFLMSVIFKMKKIQEFFSDFLHSYKGKFLYVNNVKLIGKESLHLNFLISSHNRIPNCNRSILKLVLSISRHQNCLNSATLFEPVEL